MKPAKFDYHDPTTVDEALGLMAQFGDQARPLAGGQSLVPLMNFRLIRPAHLIDLNGVNELSYLRADDDTLRIGATTRQRELERSAEVAKRWPLLRDAAAFIGHIQIRNRGTVGGSLAHAFPSAELPVAMVTLDASMVLRSTKTTRRSVGAEDFFLSYMTTALQPDELLLEIAVRHCRRTPVGRTKKSAVDMAILPWREPRRSSLSMQTAASIMPGLRSPAQRRCGRVKRKSFCSGKGRRKRCFVTPRDAQPRTWNRIRIFTPALNTAATPAQPWRDARSLKRHGGQPSR